MSATHLSVEEVADALRSALTPMSTAMSALTTSSVARSRGLSAAYLRSTASATSSMTPGTS